MAIRGALSGEVVFAKTRDALGIFRQVLADAIRDIEGHPRGRLFKEFLRKGPYVDTGKIPARSVEDYLSDADTAAAITYPQGIREMLWPQDLEEILATGKTKNGCTLH